MYSPYQNMMMQNQRMGKPQNPMQPQQPQQQGLGQAIGQSGGMNQAMMGGAFGLLPMLMMQKNMSPIAAGIGGGGVAGLLMSLLHKK